VIVAKKKSKSNQKPKEKHGIDLQSGSISNLNKPWMDMRTGLYFVTFASLVMFGLTAYQVTPQKGLFEGILWGLLFGAMIWAIFWGFYFLRKFLRF
jgi:hypothetical protein